WALCEAATAAESARFTTAAALGLHYVEAGYAGSHAVREVLALGRAVVAEAVARGLDGAGAGRLADEAAAQVVLAVETARRARRRRPSPRLDLTSSYRWRLSSLRNRRYKPLDRRAGGTYNETVGNENRFQLQDWARRRRR